VTAFERALELTPRQAAVRDLLAQQRARLKKTMG
jgi:hypothetical protein